MSVVLNEEVLQENLDFWEDRYTNNNIGWHIDEVHPHLLKYIDLLTSSEVEKKKDGLKSKKFFVPLCGKTKDIPYLLSLGHEVFGVEAVRSAIEQLDHENSLNLKYDEANSLYYTQDFKLKIHCGDFFTCPIEKWGPFDAVWDRGSFTAMDYPLRESYIDVMKRSVAYGTSHPFRYLLVTVRYDKSVFAGPPKSTDKEDIKNYFGNWVDIKELEMNSIPSDSPMRKVSGDFNGDFHEIIHFAKET